MRFKPPPKQLKPTSNVIRVGPFKEPDTPFTRIMRARAFKERLSRPDLFPDPAIEESCFQIAYGGSLEHRAKVLAAQQQKAPTK